MEERSTSFSDSNVPSLRGSKATEAIQTRGRAHEVVDIGFWEYGEAHQLQLECLDSVQKGGKEIILLTEHPPVYTCGRKTAEQDKPYWTGIPVVDVERGGELTYHGPGQIVGYPILDLRKRKLGIPQFLRLLENTLAEVLTDFGVETHVKPEHLAGLWVGDQKICSIGIALRKWVTFHGFALNVDCDLTPFHQTRPCGLSGNCVTSLTESGFHVSKNVLKEKILKKLEEVFFFK